MTITVTASMGTLSDHGLYTNLALQAGANPRVDADVTGIMVASLAASVDAALAADLAAAGTAVASVGEALAAVSGWPGQRLVVLGPSGSAQASPTSPRSPP